MTRNCIKLLFFVMFSALIVNCASKKPKPRFSADNLESHETGTTGNIAASPASFDVATMDSNADIQQSGFDNYMEYSVDNFLVILDASGSKFLPYKQQIKLKVAKDIVRRFNQRVPNRPLMGGLRRYGFEAGAFTQPTAMLYGMTNYSRPDFGEALEIVTWAGGKSPLALAIDKASDDLASTVGNIALVIVSDGKIYQGDPVQAAHRIKDRYGDRICIYTALVGDLPFGWDILDRVAKAGGCGYAVTSDCLIPDKNMDDWVDDIFSRGRKLRCAPIVAGGKIERDLPCPDEDGDGVCDQYDKCPGTPKGARVDANGCWIIGKVQFDLDKYNIKRKYYSVIDEVVRVMKLNPWLKMKVEGHTCIIASEKYNLKLSHNRAVSVVDYMIKKGIESERVSVRGHSFHVPTASNKTSQGRSLNRRVEFFPTKR
ncbi:MAG: OmpA family protein [Desulfobacteraceae bacterium]|nr:OmpA family protein [Desulfobacteraceae bacterium]